MDPSTYRDGLMKIRWMNWSDAFSLTRDVDSFERSIKDRMDTT